MSLTARQEVFVAEYLKDLNATQAAIRAGYSEKTAAEQGYQLLQIPSVVDAVAEAAAARNERVQIDGDFVLRTLHNLADFDMQSVFEADGTLKKIHDMPIIARKAISGFEVEEIFEGQGKDRTWIGNLRKVKMWSKDKALELLARHKSLLNDKVQHEHTGKDGAALEYDDASLAARMEAILTAIAHRRDGTDFSDLA